MKTNKYNYSLVIQQYYAGAYGWEDATEYAANSQKQCLERTEKEFTRKDGTTGKKLVSQCLLDANEYRLMGYPTRVIFRRTPNVNVNPQ